jgi:Ribbon-helix-helix protein, copG family
MPSQANALGFGLYRHERCAAMQTHREGIRSSMSQTRKVGRPSIGAPVTMHFPAPLIHALDELAGKLRISRSELVRRSCQAALGDRAMPLHARQLPKPDCTCVPDL